MNDARLNVALPHHPKTKKLIKKVGTDAAWRLVCLFLWAAQNKPDGVLSGMTAEDIELAVDWAGEDGAFVSALIACGFVDGNDDEGYSIHDWSEHNPWAAGAEDRSDKAKFNALCKHHGREEAAKRMPEYAAKHPANKQQVASSSATSMHAAENSTAPSPSPSPSPSEVQEAKASVADESATHVEQKPTCPSEAIVSLYHELMPNNPAVKVLNNARRGAIRSRWKEAASLDCAPFGYSSREEGLKAWRAFFTVCNESDFLTGKVAGQPGKPPFVADIDFLMSPSGFAKCLENKYHRELA